VEEEQGNAAQALFYLQQEVKYSPSSDTIKKHIQELQEGKPKTLEK